MPLEWLPRGCPFESFKEATSELDQSELDRDIAIELRIMSAVNLTHIASTNGGMNLVPPEARARRERHISIDQEIARLHGRWAAGQEAVSEQRLRGTKRTTLIEG